MQVVVVVVVVVVVSLSFLSDMEVTRVATSSQRLPNC